jgi:plasmid stabilization system protein ParE
MNLRSGCQLNRSAEQAGRWLDGIHKRLQDLTSEPLRFPLAGEHKEFPYELREIHFGLGRRPTHRAIFTIAEDFVIVLTVRHAAQDRLHPDDL